MDIVRLESHYHHVMTGGGAIATYLVTGAGGRAALIDAGAGDADHLRALADGLQAPGSGLRHVPDGPPEGGPHSSLLEDVFVTHGHIDHVGGAPALQAAYPGARFSKHEPVNAFAVEGVSSIDWRPLVDGQTVDAAGTPLTVLHTPGHAPDHVVFWHEASGTAFTGDLVISGSSVIIPHTRGGDLLDYLASIERVRELRPSRLLPAHGPEINDPEAVLLATREHRERREREILERLSARTMSVPGLVESIYHGLAPGLARAAQESVRAHLEKLRREGRVVEDNGLWQER